MADLWHRHLSEYAAELFAYNYIIHKFADRAANADFQNYVDAMKNNLDKMNKLRREKGRSYGVKDVELADKARQLKAA
jgi:hypothetical protein